MGIFIFASWLFIMGCVIYAVKIDHDSYKIIKEMAAEVDRLTAEVKRLDSVVSILTDKELLGDSEGFDGEY